MVAVFLSLVAQFYLPGTGFTSLLSIGSRLDERAVEKLRAVPHYAIEDSWGYDGTYYVQLALHPTLDQPAELGAAIDNLSYRARRICRVGWRGASGWAATRGSCTCLQF